MQDKENKGMPRERNKDVERETPARKGHDQQENIERREDTQRGKNDQGAGGL